MNSEYIENMTDVDLTTLLKNFGVNVGPMTATTRLVYERKLSRILQDDISAGQFGDFFNSSIMSSENITEISNEELAAALKNAGVTVGPITATTRLVYERKLLRIQQNDKVPAANEDEKMEEEEEDEPEPVYEEKTSERLTSVHQRFTSPLTSKISGGNNPPTYIGTPGSSQLNTSLTRKPLSSMREEVKFTSLRNSQSGSGSSANAASTPKKGGVSIMLILFVLIVFGLIFWLIYINFESPAAKPLLTSSH